MFQRFRALSERVKFEADIYRFVLTDPRVPRSAKWLLGGAVAYALSPIDLIPDFIPILGHVDDALIVPLLAWLALRHIPPEVLADARLKASQGRNHGSPGQSPES
jgi:uncharacterized membrane protein YkvA (DUF1232 family)